MTIKEEQYLKAFAKNLKKLRISKGYSTRKFADKVEVSHSTVIRMESAKTNPTLTIICKLVDVLDTDANNLLMIKTVKQQ